MSYKHNNYYLKAFVVYLNEMILSRIIKQSDKISLTKTRFLNDMKKNPVYYLRGFGSFEKEHKEKKENEEKKLIDYLTKTYGNPEKRSTDKTGIAYFWDASDKNKWLFLIQTQELTKDNAKYTNTQLIVVKKGTRVENASNPNTFSILDSFTLVYPKK